MSLWFYDRPRYNDFWDVSPFYRHNPWREMARDLERFDQIQRSVLREFGDIPNAGQVQVTNDDQKLAISMDVRSFDPEEVQVKVAGDSLVVEGKHEERQDEHGYVQRYFQRRYVLPQDVNPQMVQSRLSSDGILTVEAPKRAIEGATERAIPVQHTGQPALTQEKDKKKEQKKK